MNKREMELLGKAFDAEVGAALSGGIHLMQSKSKLADQMVDEGMFRKKTMLIGGRLAIEITGFELTDLGRMTYCMSFEPPPEVGSLNGRRKDHQ